MFEYFVRRVITLFVTLVIASIVIFISLEIIPGDPASYMLGINAQEDTLLDKQENSRKKKTMKVLETLLGSTNITRTNVSAPPFDNSSTQQHRVYNET